jgi:phosphoribosylglycinamide formyltransferase-1
MPVTPDRLPRLAVLISGSGSTLQNLIERTRDGSLRAEVAGVVASKPGILGIQRAERFGVPCKVVERKPAETFQSRLFQAIGQFNPDLVVLAGWLHLLRIPEGFGPRIVNVHPSLLPAFGGHGMYGHHVHEAVLAAGEKESGCTVHLVDDTYDTGPILLQKRVPVLPDDSPDTLAARVQAAEREAYPEAIAELLTSSPRSPARR